MQCLDDFSIQSETSLNSKIFNAQLTRSLIPAKSCGACPKDFELPVPDESEVRLHDLSVGLLQRSQSGVRRKVGNVPTISLPGFDQVQSFKAFQLKGRLKPQSSRCGLSRVVSAIQFHQSA
jgi:hypothetical protein